MKLLVKLDSFDETDKQTKTERWEGSKKLVFPVSSQLSNAKHKHDLKLKNDIMRTSVCFTHHKNTVCIEVNGNKPFRLNSGQKAEVSYLK